MRQLHLISIGLCEKGCGRKLASKALCYHCLVKQRIRDRRRDGCKPQGGRNRKGRPRIPRPASTHLAPPVAAGVAA